ncbi:MAG TPA: sodium:proton antiporter [Polyangiaceae bacterium]
MARPEIVLVLLFSIATGVAILARRLRVPYTVALVIAGLAFGASAALPGIRLTKDLLFSVLLPGLVFEAAYQLRFEDLRKNALAILVLSVPGVAASMGATAAVLTWSASTIGRPIGLGTAIVFGAVVAATDPIAVVALFKSLGAPKRLAVLLEAESLVNDGTAIVLFTIVLSMVSGAHVDVVHGVIDFGRIVGLGAAVGFGFGGGARMLLRRVDDAMIEITVSMIAAYGSFGVAEELGVSGVIATVVAGVGFGSYRETAMSEQTKASLGSFWEYVAFALNSIAFLLIGLSVHVGSLVRQWLPIALAFVAVVLGRAIIVALGTLVVRPTHERIPWTWSAVLTWGGLRGALSMVLALSLPADFPERELVVTMTFGVVLLSILVQGTTTSLLLKKLGLVEAAPSS